MSDCAFTETSFGSIPYFNKPSSVFTLVHQRTELLNTNCPFLQRMNQPVIHQFTFRADETNVLCHLLCTELLLKTRCKVSTILIGFQHQVVPLASTVLYVITDAHLDSALLDD